MNFENASPRIGASRLAIVTGMDKRFATTARRPVRSFAGVLRGFAEASLVVFAFGFAILLIGAPIALIVRGLLEGLSWIAKWTGNLSPFVGALVAAIVAGSIAATGVLVLVASSGWRRR